MTGLIRVYPRRRGRWTTSRSRCRRRDGGGRRGPRPPRARPVVHRARVWGPSARFDGQRSGATTSRGRRRRRGRPAMRAVARVISRGLHGLSVLRARGGRSRGRSAARLGARRAMVNSRANLFCYPPGSVDRRHIDLVQEEVSRRHRGDSSRFTWARATIPSGTSSGRAACSPSSPVPRSSSRTASDTELRPSATDNAAGGGARTSSTPDGRTYVPRLQSGTVGRWLSVWAEPPWEPPWR